MNRIHLEALGRLRRFLDTCCSNLAAERAVRGNRPLLGNWPLAGSDAGGHGAAVVTVPMATGE